MRTLMSIVILGVICSSSLAQQEFHYEDEIIITNKKNPGSNSGKSGPPVGPSASGLPPRPPSTLGSSPDFVRRNIKANLKRFRNMNIKNMSPTLQRLLKEREAKRRAEAESKVKADAKAMPELNTPSTIGMPPENSRPATVDDEWSAEKELKKGEEAYAEGVIEAYCLGTVLLPPSLGAQIPCIIKDGKRIYEANDPVETTHHVILEKSIKNWLNTLAKNDPSRLRRILVKLAGKIAVKLPEENCLY